MLNKKIIGIMSQLREDIPNFYALENINIKLAEEIANWIEEDRNHIRKNMIKSFNRKKSGSI